MQIAALVFIGVMQSILMAILFDGIGAEKITIRNYKESPGIITDWLGMVFLAISDQFLMCTAAVVFVIPLSLPVYKRERGSHMYTPNSYFIAGTLSNITANMFYPLLVSLITFWFYQYPESDFYGFFLFFLVQAAGALTGLMFGQVIGSVIDNEATAFILLMQSWFAYITFGQLMSMM